MNMMQREQTISVLTTENGLRETELIEIAEKYIWNADKECSNSITRRYGI